MNESFPESADLMTRFMKHEVESLKSSKTFGVIAYSLAKIAAAVALMYFLEYGIFLVVAYLLYSLESNTALQNLNVHESNYKFALLELKAESEILTLRDQLNELKEQLAEIRENESDSSWDEL